MFAGAARAAVFSAEGVAERVNRDFIPVALKAGQVNNPPLGAEGKLYAEIGRSKPAPQGICVVNSDCKVLGWALSFDEDASVAAFLDYAVRRFEDSPDANQPVTAERFMRYPSRMLPDVEDTGRRLVIPDRHTTDDRCPANPAIERGTLVGRIVGRPLDEDGQPIKRTVRQEEYMEATFRVPVSLQQQFARAMAKSTAGGTFPVPPGFARLLVSQAYLGQLDVNPLGGRQTGGQTDHESIEFSAQLLNSGKGRVHISGTSDVAGGPSNVGVRTDGRRWEHRVQLTWEGYLDVQDDRITGLVLAAEGTERLRWGSERWNLAGEPEVAHLMAGHPIDLDCKVRYGLRAEPIAEDQAAGRAPAGSGERTNRVGENRPSETLITPRQRLNHLRQAIAHLRAAGVADLADELAQQADQLEASLATGREPRKN